MTLNLGGHRLNHLSGIAGGSLVENIEHPVVAELLVIGILSLVQSVCVDEEHAALDAVDLLALVLEFREYADGHVGNHLHEFTGVLISYDRPVMTRVTEVEVSRLEIHQSEEEGDKHTSGITVGEGFVHTDAYLGRHHALRCQCAEEARGLSHEERGRYALAADIADAEVEFVPLKEVAVEVAAHFLGWRHRGIHVETIPLGESAGHHTHLDLTGNTQFTINALLGGCGILQLIDIVYQRMLHIAKRLGQVAYLVDTSVVRQVLVELSGSDDFRLAGQQS